MHSSPLSEYCAADVKICHQVSRESLAIQQESRVGCSGARDVRAGTVGRGTLDEAGSMIANVK